MAVNEPTTPLFPDKIGPLAQRIVNTLTVEEFCELVAHVFQLDEHGGHICVEMHFDGRHHLWSKMESGRIGTDQLGRARMASSDNPS